MAVHSARRIIREAVHEALVPFEPVADVEFLFMIATNDLDPEDPPSVNRDNSKPTVYIVREVQGAQVPQGHLSRVSATGAGVLRYSIFVQAGAGAKWHDELDEEIRTKLDTFTDSPSPLGYVAFATEAVVDSVRGISEGFMHIEYAVPATVIGDF